MRYAGKTCGMSMDTTTQKPALSRRIAEEIRVAMVRRGMTGVQLARRLGVSQPWVSYRLTGAQEIGTNDLERIAEALDVQIIDLLPRAVAEIPRTLGYAQTYVDLSHVTPAVTPSRPPDNRPRRGPGRPGRPGPSATRTRRVGS